MAAKISKDELAIILKNIANKENYDDMQEAIEKVADEYGIDLTEVEEDEESPIEDTGFLMVEDDIFLGELDEESDENW